MTRRSPLHDALERLRPDWMQARGMPMPARYAGENQTAPILLGDLSPLERVGLKGASAEQWLHSQGLSVPPEVNSWAPLEDGLIARLGTTEFFIEDGIRGHCSARLQAALGGGSARVYPVLRQDAALVLTGPAVHSLLLETCSINFAGFDYDQRRVVMTSMVGVSVLIIRWLRAGVPWYRIWCDASFGPYLWTTLLEVARDLGGGAVGVRALFPDWDFTQA